MRPVLDTQLLTISGIFSKLSWQEHGWAQVELVIESRTQMKHRAANSLTCVESMQALRVRALGLIFYDDALSGLFCANLLCDLRQLSSRV